MKQFYLFLLYVFIFGLGIFIGGFSRFLWLVTYQKSIIEKKFIYKPLIEAKGGGNTPQEAWIGYLNALEKGNIEEALEYVWPEEREKFRETLLKLKQKGFLDEYAKNFDKVLIKPLKIYKTLEENEVLFENRQTINKEVELKMTEDERTKNFLIELWKNEPEIFTATSTIIFKYNPYSKKWLIKE